MTATARYQVAIWLEGDPEPGTATVVIPEEWGSAAAFMEEIESELQDLQDDADIVRFQVTPLDCTDMQPNELRQWITEFRKDGDV